MGSSLISIGVAVNQNRSIISDIDDVGKNYNKSKEFVLNEDLLLETPTVKQKSADHQLKLNQNFSNKKSTKIGKIAKFREKAKEEQHEQPVVYSMVSQL